MKTLIPILGDQLSAGLPSLHATPPRDAVVVMAEVWEEATYVKHHKKKIALVFTAMRHFADELRAAGWTVDYCALDDPANSGSLTGEMKRAIARHAPDRIVVTEASEWRVAEALRGWSAHFGLPVEILTDSRFIASRAQFERWAEAKKQLRMEFFYREMRRSTGLLMDGADPAGGAWNFDKENRKPAGAGLSFPDPPSFEPDAVTEAVLELVAAHFPDHFGDLTPFWFAPNAAGAEIAFAHFLELGLPRFGDFQDAMLKGEKYLYHAVVSVYLNLGLLDPLDMCRRAEAEYLAGRAPLNAVEGFIRQILGWREYVRGIYWLKMPGYEHSNFLAATRPLPGFYWTGETGMACIRACVEQTREEAYAHHIQRLMVTGNFALLAGIDPYLVNEWYLIVYADAYEWVELPNTVGMALFGDGGVLASKPYAASGNYINKMSDYCKGCKYDVKQRVGPDACPFNALYWHFFMRNRAKLGRNPRLQPILRTLDRMSEPDKAGIEASAAAFLAALSPSPRWP